MKLLDALPPHLESPVENVSMITVAAVVFVDIFIVVVPDFVISFMYLIIILIYLTETKENNQSYCFTYIFRVLF